MFSHHARVDGLNRGMASGCPLLGTAGSDLNSRMTGSFSVPSKWQKVKNYAV